MADRAAFDIQGYGDPSLLRKAFMIPAVLYPLWHLAAPDGAIDPWAGWFAVAASFWVVGLASLASSWVERHLATGFHLCSWLVTLQLYLLAFANDMHPFYAFGSVMAVLATIPSIRTKPILLAYGIFVLHLTAVLFGLAPSALKAAYWGATLTVLAGSYHRLSIQVAAARLTRDHQMELERRVKERTQELSEANRRLRREMERREGLEEELRLSQKMEAVGRLAGGVAHDFNNVLTTIRLYAEMLGDRLPVDQREEVERIQKAGRQAATLTQQLLTFSRRGEIQVEVLDLDEAVRDASTMLRHLLGEDIELVCWVDDGPHPIRADPGRIEQVLVNLALNARDAMPEGGRLTIETSWARRGDLAGRDLPDSLADADFVVLTVADTGIGMDRETRDRAFDPFFTRKQVDRGTGLGLSVVYGIATQAGGTVRLHSEEGKGSRFELYWPVCEEEPTAALREIVPSADTGGDERILVVEDENDLRGALLRLLRGQGYRVTAASDAEQALSVLESGETPDLVLTDVVMPRMSGLELAERVGARWPRARVLLMSGHLNHPSLRDRDLPADVAFLPKPFEPQDLTTKVREVLDA